MLVCPFKIACSSSVIGLKWEMISKLIMCSGPSFFCIIAFSAEKVNFSLGQNADIAAAKITFETFSALKFNDIQQAAVNLHKKTEKYYEISQSRFAIIEHIFSVIDLHRRRILC